MLLLCGRSRRVLGIHVGLTAHLLLGGYDVRLAL